MRLTSFCLLLGFFYGFLFLCRLFFPLKDPLEEINSSFHKIIDVCDRVVLLLSETLRRLYQDRAPIKIDYITLHNLVDVFSDVIHSGKSFQKWDQFQELLIFRVIRPRGDRDSVAMLEGVALWDVVDENNIS